MSLKLNSSGGGSVTLQEPVTASNRTLTLPDATGSLITESMVLLGTLTTTSGTTQVLSGLDLTNYKSLIIWLNGVSFTAGVAMTLNTVTITEVLTAAAQGFFGILQINLSNSVFAITQDSVTPATTFTSPASVYVGKLSVTNSTTSLTFAGGTFDAGTIEIYGVK